MKKDISLIDYFTENKEHYLKMDLKDIIKNIQVDILKAYPEMISLESKTLVMVESLENAIESLNFNWLRDLSLRNDLVWFNHDETVDNLNLFFESNQKYFTNLNKTKFEVVIDIIENWQYYIGELLSNTGSFQNKLFHTNRELMFIKTIDSEEWLANPELFVTKKFGDQTSKVSLNFIYKENDQDFESSNLAEKILKFKTEQLLK